MDNANRHFINKEERREPPQRQKTDIPVQNTFLPVMLLKQYISKEEI